jgi:hypothetical protein
MPRLFDAYIMVDWSAASKPVTGANSIWVGMLARDARLKLQFQAVNIDTRLKARTFLLDMATKLTGRGDRILMGFDFSLGYPAGTASALGLPLKGAAPWAATHEFLAQKLKDKADNSNARYAIAAGMNYTISKQAFPFWGAPPRDQVSTLAGTRPEFKGQALREFRHTESNLRDSKKASPKSSWQLSYTDSVGSQSLTGIPHVHALRQTLPGARIWPFEFGAGAIDENALEGVKTLIAEIYPSQLKFETNPGETLDEAQVRAMTHHYAALDEKNQLGARFALPQTLSESEIGEIQGEEGWILSI